MGRGAGALVWTLAGVLAACSGGSGSRTGAPAAPTPVPSAPASSGSAATPDVPPSNLGLPVDVAQIVLVGVINPFGVVRSSLDQGLVGHPGIDLPSNTGAPIFGVADGEIMMLELETDGMPGSEIWLLIAAASSPRTGWIFLYEHVDPLSGLAVGSTVVKGQQIGTNPQNPAFTNHLELSFVFNEQGFRQSQTCWVDQLDAGARATLLDRFTNDLRTSQRFIDAWMTVQFEGQLPFTALLDPARYPDGAQLCYPPGTDVRVSP